MPKLSTCLWFDGQAEDAANFYCSIFPNSKIKSVTHYDQTVASEAEMPPGTVMTVTFDLDGKEYMGLNGGPAFKFSEAISIMVHCDTQEELDRYWSKLSEGGEESVCGWLKDKYGLSWQIVPKILGQYFESGEVERTNRVMHEVMHMTKLDIETLERAYAG